MEGRRVQKTTRVSGEDIIPLQLKGNKVTQLISHEVSLVLGAKQEGEAEGGGDSLFFHQPQELLFSLPGQNSSV